MGFFDRLAGKPDSPAPAGGNGVPMPSGIDAPVTGVAPRLITARERLEQKDVAGALAIYEEVLAAAGSSTWSPRAMTPCATARQPAST